MCSAAYWWLHCERGKGPLLIEADIACGSKIDHGRGAETYGAAMLSSFLLRMGSDMLTECCRWESIGRVWVSVGAEELCSAVQSAGKQLGLPPLNYPPRLKRVNLWRAGRQIEDSTVNYPKRQRCGDAVWQHAASHVRVRFVARTLAMLQPYTHTPAQPLHRHSRLSPILLPRRYNGTAFIRSLPGAACYVHLPPPIATPAAIISPGREPSYQHVASPISTGCGTSLRKALGIILSSAIVRQAQPHRPSKSTLV